MAERLRIAVGGIEHESCSFTTARIELKDFLAEGRFFDERALLARSGEANTIVDGFLRELRRQGAAIVPLIWSHPPSGAQPSRETLETIKEMMLLPLRGAVPV